MRLFKRKRKDLFGEPVMLDPAKQVLMFSRLPGRRIPVKAGNLGTQMGFGVRIIVRKPRKIEVTYVETK